MVVYPPGTLFVGQRFQTKEQMQDAINRFHIVNHCTYKVKNSSSSRLVMECVHHDCAWRCRGILRTREQHWEIMILEGPHTCVSPLISQDHNKLGSQMIAQSIGEIIEVDPSTSISTIIAHIKSTMGYTISYKKGWLAKQHAIENIFGNWEESYNKLPGMLQAMQMYVPGFIWKLNTQPAYEGGLLDEGSLIFKRLFKVHIPCSHVLASCLHAHHDYESYISLIYTLQQVAKVYEGQFGELRHEDYWPTYTGPTLWPNPELKRTSKGPPKSTRIRTEMNIKEQHSHVKNCSYCHTPGHTRKTCPNISHGCSSRHH
uniref:Transposase MuDR plant domain-containing protein n=1 Tax=Cajanus cajan TaxID=3821 RepID=A0A151R8S7_CAJCA|nr:hypothetical protein KK1_039761 [Cajanus cajan]